MSIFDRKKKAVPVQPLSFRTLNKIVEKLHLFPNSILMIKPGSELANAENIGRLADAIGKTEIPNVLIMVGELSELRVIGEKTLNQNGWFHIEQLGRLVARQHEKEIMEAENEGAGQSKS